MKKIVAFIILFTISCWRAQAGTITLVTYYPAPIGAFEELCLDPASAELESPCEIGTMYFNSDGRFMACQENTSSSNAWFSPGIWVKNGKNVSLSETAINPHQFVGIGTSHPEFKLTLAKRSGIIAKGALVSGADLNISNLGTSLLWHPKRAVFRAGTVTATQWATTNSGTNSTAFGYDTTAFAPYSTAFGYEAYARGFYSFSMGKKTFSKGLYSVAMGLETETTTLGQMSVAIGAYAKANGTASAAFGKSTEASGWGSLVFGNQSKATGDYAVAMGSLAVAQTKSFSLGTETTSNKEASIAIGYKTVTDGRCAIAMGEETQANGSSSVAVGLFSEANGLYSVAMGTHVIVSEEAGIGLGNAVAVQERNSVAMGSDLSVSPRNVFVCGQFNNDFLGDPSVGVFTNPLFVIGNGIDSLHRNNAVTVLTNGNVGIGTDAPSSILSVKGIEEHADNAAALAAGHTIGAVYRTGEVLKIVH